MAEGSRSAKRASSPNWLASLMGAVFLISAGFMLGLVFGVVKEEPQLVISHIAGESEEVRWSEQDSGLGLPDVSAQGDALDAPEDPYAFEGGVQGDDLAAPEVAAAEDTASLSSAPAYQAPQREAVVAPQVRKPVAEAPSAGSGFSVQVGAFGESESAERVAGDLRAKGFPVYVTPKAGSPDGRWRVRVGPVQSRSEADEIAQQLKTREGMPTWVLSEGGG